jgi:hypothetical protein
MSGYLVQEIAPDQYESDPRTGIVFLASHFRLYGHIVIHDAPKVWVPFLEGVGVHWHVHFQHAGYRERHCGYVQSRYSLGRHIFFEMPM